MTKREDVVLTSVEMEAKESEEGTSYIRFSWVGNIGWGEYLLFKPKGEEKWETDSECMDTSADPWFLNLLWKKFLETELKMNLQK